MDNRNPQEQAVAVKIATEATEPPINLIAKMKAIMASQHAPSTDFPMTALDK